MNEPDADHDIRVAEPPLAAGLTEALLLFWTNLFHTDYTDSRGRLAGHERRQNRDTIYYVEKQGSPAGTCHLVTSLCSPELGGLGEVGTEPRARGAGIASALCRRARNDFHRAGGQALFLGTVNPAAARVYHAQGWRKIVGAELMVWVADGRTPEEFLVDYFRLAGGTPAVSRGTAAQRIPMIPLIITPHDWQLLDANTNLLSTRYAAQISCMGFYPRYARLESDGRGSWFAASTDQESLVGLSSCRLDEDGSCQVDGFAHHRFPGSWRDLMVATISWAAAHDACLCWARVSVEDKEKTSLFEALGFEKVGDAEPVELGQRTVGALRLQREP